MYRLSHVTCVSLPLTADSVSFPDDLHYSFQHGLLNTTLVQSLVNTTSITLPPSQRPHLSSTVTVPADTSSRVPDKDDLLHCSTADLPHREDDNSALSKDTQSQGTSISKLEQKPSDTAPLDNPQAVSNLEFEQCLLAYFCNAMPNSADFPFGRAIYLQYVTFPLFFPTANCQVFSILVEGSVLTTMREATLEVTTALH